MARIRGLDKFGISCIRGRNCCIYGILFHFEKDQRLGVALYKTVALWAKTFLLGLNSFQIVMLNKLPNGNLIVDRHFTLHVSVTLI